MREDPQVVAMATVISTTALLLAALAACWPRFRI
jgi:hypothetical protein